MKTLVIGASSNPGRISNQLIHRLRSHKMEVYAMGKTSGTTADVPIKTTWPENEDIHTVSIYISPRWQTDEWQNNLLAVQPQRVIFNPGTENFELAEKLRKKGIEVLNACTLVMISTGQY